MKVTRYEDVQVGESAESTHTVTEDDIEAFGNLSGDFNPLHFNEEWANKTMFKGRIAHGILTASFISAVIGMKLPGTGTIYISQEMKFKRPVRIDDIITTSVEVISKDDENHHIKLKTTCENQNSEVVLDGYATVALMRMTQ